MTPEWNNTLLISLISNNNQTRSSEPLSPLNSKWFAKGCHSCSILLVEGVWKSRKPESGIGTGIGTRTGNEIGTGIGKGTHINGMENVLIRFNVNFIFI